MSKVCCRFVPPERGFNLVLLTVELEFVKFRGKPEQVMSDGPCSFLWLHSLWGVHASISMKMFPASPCSCEWWNWSCEVAWTGQCISFVWCRCNIHVQDNSLFWLNVCVFIWQLDAQILAKELQKRFAGQVEDEYKTALWNNCQVFFYSSELTCLHRWDRKTKWQSFLRVVISFLLHPKTSKNSNEVRSWVQGWRFQRFKSTCI